MYVPYIASTAQLQHHTPYKHGLFQVYNFQYLHEGDDDDDEKGDDDNNNNSTPDVDKMASNARLKAGKLFHETTGILIAIQDRIISTNNYKKHILNDLNN